MRGCLHHGAFIPSVLSLVSKRSRRQAAMQRVAAACSTAAVGHRGAAWLRTVRGKSSFSVGYGSHPRESRRHCVRLVPCSSPADARLGPRAATLKSCQRPCGEPSVPQCKACAHFPCNSVMLRRKPRLTWPLLSTLWSAHRQPPCVSGAFQTYSRRRIRAQTACVGSIPSASSRAWSPPTASRSPSPVGCVTRGGVGGRHLPHAPGHPCRADRWRCDLIPDGVMAWIDQQYDEHMAASLAAVVLPEAHPVLPCRSLVALNPSLSSSSLPLNGLLA